VLTFVGVGLGVVGALALARFIESLLYEIPPRDPLTYATVCVTLAAVALLASYIPALRATRVDPMIALRYE
jgi:putative ABC transport system permease protein